MLALCCLIFLSFFLEAPAERIDINAATDVIFQYANNYLREQEYTLANLEEIDLTSNVSYSGASLFGLDSLQRTSDCWYDEQVNSSTVTCNFGLRFFVVNLKKLTVGGQDMSAFFRVRNNSVSVAFTKHTENGCHYTLDDLRLERLSDVEFGSSVAEFDGLNIEEFLADVLVPKLNGLINIPGLETFLQYLCPQEDEDSLEHATFESIISSFFKRN